MQNQNKPEGKRCMVDSSLSSCRLQSHGVQGYNRYLRNDIFSGGREKPAS